VREQFGNLPCWQVSLFGCVQKYRDKTNDTLMVGCIFGCDQVFVSEELTQTKLVRREPMKSIIHLAFVIGFLALI
jgi:hypothetical protein